MARLIPKLEYDPLKNWVSFPLMAITFYLNGIFILCNFVLINPDPVNDYVAMAMYKLDDGASIRVDRPQRPKDNVLPEITKHLQSDEILCLALNAYFEARGSSIEDQMAVSQVVLNRMDDPRWPDKACDVIYQHRQFSWTQDGKSDKPIDLVSWREAQLLAYLVYNDYIINTVDRANHYHATYVEPNWTLKESRTRVGGHYYMKW